MAVFNNILAGASGQTTEAGAYQISRSVRFNSSDSAYLSRTPGSAGNRKTWTWAGWVKRSSGDQFNYLFDAVTTDPSTGENRISFENNKIKWYSNSTTDTVETLAVFRDFSAWYHIVFAYNSTEATSSDRIKVYVNGVQQTLTGTYPALNAEPHINNTRVHNIGRSAAYGRYFNGYLADIHFIDGQALDPTSFTETDATTGQLVPIEYTGSFGTNGFHLPFSDNSTAAALGTDTSGNGNDWDVYNISVVNISRDYTNLNCSSTGNVSAIYINSVSQTVNVANLNTLLASSQFHDRASGGNGYEFQLPGTSGSTVTLNYSNMNNLNSVKIRLQRVSTTDSTVRVEITGAATSDVVATSTSQEFSFATTTSSGTIKLTTQNSSNGVVCQDIFFDPGDTTSDSLVDTPTNGSQTDTGVGGEVVGNYCTLNPLQNSNGDTFSNGNLDISTSYGSYGTHTSTVATPLSGKWYAEVTVNSSSGYTQVGLASTASVFSTSSYLGSLNGVAYRGDNGNKMVDGVLSSYGATYGTGAIIGIAYDADAGTVVFYKNGSSQGSITLTVRSYYFAGSDYNSTGSDSLTWNFGQRPFAYTAPSGFKALCTANLDDPLVAQPSTVMDVVTYTGNGTSQTISGLGFSPDFAWFKNRATTKDPRITDTIRGTGVELYPNSTTGDYSQPQGVTAFNSDGVSVGSDGGYNGSGQGMVLWAWDAGSSTVSNTDGSITSTVRANASAGFSIVTYTAPATNTVTIGHGLNAAPEFILVKGRNKTYNWDVYHVDIGPTKRLMLNLSNAAETQSGVWNNTAPTSTVFSSKSNGAWYASGDTLVAYCFAPVDGYSSFGSYTGNGSADGPFVYTGFRPKWVLRKNATTGGTNWYMHDAERNSYNVCDLELKAQDSAAENTFTALDITSNGFKIRTSNSNHNGSGDTYIYAAFAESPFKTARAR